MWLCCVRNAFNQDAIRGRGSVCWGLWWSACTLETLMAGPNITRFHTRPWGSAFNQWIKRHWHSYSSVCGLLLLLNSPARPNLALGLPPLPISSPFFKSLKNTLEAAPPACLSQENNARLSPARPTAHRVNGWGCSFRRGRWKERQWVGWGGGVESY